MLTYRLTESFRDISMSQTSQPIQFRSRIPIEEMQSAIFKSSSQEYGHVKPYRSDL